MQPNSSSLLGKRQSPQEDELLYLNELPVNAEQLPCLGAIIGDTVGSIYELDNIKTTEFPLFSANSSFTDDSVMTMAVAEWLLYDKELTHLELERSMVKWGFRYEEIGYGPSFKDWLFRPYYKNMDLFAKTMNIQSVGIRRPYYSWGNGSAMRCSACGWAAKSLDEAIDLGGRSAAITHNHPEGIRGAEAVAAAIFLARQGADKEEIRNFIERRFYYDLHFDCDDIRPKYKWEESCQGTVPPAIVAFLDSYDFESAIRLAVSLGGDSDTLTCITGGIAQAYYKHIPDQILTEMSHRLPAEFWHIMQQLAKQMN